MPAVSVSFAAALALLLQTSVLIRLGNHFVVRLRSSKWNLEQVCLLFVCRDRTLSFDVVVVSYHLLNLFLIRSKGALT
jgi:hypothetical protein